MNDLETVIRFKKTDRIIQIIGGIIVIGCAPFTWLMSFFLLGFIHALGTFFWLFAAPKAGVLPARKVIQWINILVMALWGGALLINSGYLEQTIVVMIFLGPVLGISYFVITLREINYYQSLRKHESA